MDYPRRNSTKLFTIITNRSILWVFIALSLLQTGCGITANGWNAEGVKLYETGHFPEAIERFQYALGTDEQNADAYYNMAVTYHQMGLKSNDQGFLTESEALYNRCLDFDGDHTDCHRGLAVLLAHTDRKDKALSLLNNWAQDKPHLSAAKVELARLHQELGDIQTARIQLEKACSIDRNDARAWKALAALNESEGRTEIALAQYQRSYLLDNQQTQLPGRIASLNQQIRTGVSSPNVNTNPRVANQNISRGRY
ncbi:MAG: hypothetical protein CMJ76_01070 [Planctomycetaceae bacterium]|nr:hypothetical protein [Planctomycetaceae bacterium]|tara:strand:+ start:1763 stop:2524 length:762 start_codon:yes stop_codon:yes gene_type:complete